MKKQLLRGISTILASMMIVTTMPVQSVQAEDVTIKEENLIKGTLVEEIATEDETLEEINLDTSLEENVNQPIVEKEAVDKEAFLNYLYINEAEQEVGEVQNILVSWGDGTEDIQGMELIVEDASGNQVVLSQNQRAEETFLFSNVFAKGIYHVSAINVLTSAEKRMFTADELEVNAYFGVGETYTGNEKSAHMEMESVDDSDEANQEVETSIVTIDENGETTAQSSIASAMAEVGVDNQQSTFELNSRARTKSLSSDVVVVLDPGHDTGHAGASGNGVREEVATLKIAQACKEELEQYYGVTVYMTREGSECPYPETVGVKSGNILDIQKRVAWAVSKEADVFVSFHLNSAVAGAYGAEVYYPSTSGDGKELAQDILNKLVALGLRPRGVKTNDEYAVIKNSMANGFPGLIIEHAFVSNASDVNNYLNSDEKLKNLGIADAEGIVEYFGLSKTPNPNIEINSKDDFSGICQIDVMGMWPGSTVRIWNEQNQEIFKEYILENGRDEIAFNVSDYNNARGNYYIEVYDSAGTLLCEKAFYVSKDTSCIVTAESVNGEEKQYVITAEFADMPSEVEAVSIPVWHSEDQSDIRWYPATQVAQGKWQAEVKISDYKASGLYNVHAYATLIKGNKTKVGFTTFNVSSPKATVDVNYQESAGIFEIIVKDIEAPSGISSISVPVWSEEDGQNDIVWYDAEKQNDGTYIVRVNIADHGYSIGTYKIHTYITMNNGIFDIANRTTQEVSLPNMEISAQSADGKETAYKLQITNTGLFGEIKNVQFATWSEEGGQDDIIWYQGSRGTLGEWKATADVRKHRTAGNYNVHVYATLANGSLQFLGKTEFTVSKPTLSVTTENYDETAGTFDVKISNVSSPSGVSSISVPVWRSENQKDIIWYEAEKQEDGTYKTTVSIANHNYLVGEYKVHTYIRSGNGIMVFGGATVSPVVSIPNMEISATSVDGKETTYKLQVTNTGLYGVIKNVQFATWSEEGGQDDIIWYQGSRGVLGEWKATADVRKHRTAGNYNVHVYATLANGSLQFLGKTEFTVSKPTLSVTTENYDETAGTFDVKISNVSSPSGVSSISVPVWRSENQKDIIWYEAGKQEDGTYKTTVSIANHNYLVGEYKVHTYIRSGNGIMVFGGATVSPVVSIPNMEISATSVDGKETTYKLQVTNTGLYGVIKNVQFATWSEEGGQDDIIWYQGSRGALGEWKATADIRKHRTAGNYNVHVYATLANGSLQFLGKTEFAVSKPTLSVIVENYDETAGTFDVKISNVDSPSGVSSISVPVWCASDQSDIIWYAAKKQEDGSYKVSVNPIDHNNNLGLYKIHVYMTTGNGIFTCVDRKTQLVNVAEYYTIMGDTTTTVDQMVAFYKNSGCTYPAYELGLGGAVSIEEFCQIYYEEAEAESVRAEVAFAQAMLETGWLQFGNIVRVEQFNFAGIGALDGNATGDCASFPDVRTGIRAQIQHLKAYGCEEPLNNEQVDPRFHLVKRGVAPYVEWLGIKENPLGAGWAGSVNYGPRIVAMIKKLKTM